MKKNVLTMLAILASPVLAFPCECSTSPFPDAVIGADLVILGRIAKVEPTDPSGGWTIEIAVTKVLRGASSPKSVRIGGGRIAGCEWTADEFTRARRADRVWAFALDRYFWWNDRYWLYQCNRNWTRIKTPQLGGDYTEAELQDLVARKPPTGHRS